MDCANGCSNGERVLVSVNLKVKERVFMRDLIANWLLRFALVSGISVEIEDCADVF